MATPQRRWIVGLGALLAASSLASRAAAVAGDDFDDGVVDLARWPVDQVLGNGWLDETNGRLEWRVAAPSGLDATTRFWAVHPRLDESWEMEILVSNTSEPDQTDQVDSFGLYVESQSDPGDNVFVELYASSLDFLPWRRGFYAEVFADGASAGFADSLDLGQHASDVAEGIVRISYDAGDRVLHCYYDLTGGVTGGVELASFGIAGSGGSSATVDWGLAPGDRVRVGVYGFSANRVVPSGEMYGDLFLWLGPGPVPQVPGLAPWALAALALLMAAAARARPHRRLAASPTPAE